MTAEEFLEKRWRLRPSVEDMSPLGLSASFVSRIRSEFEVDPKSGSVAPYSDELIRLVELYDMTKVEIGALTFRSNAQRLFEHVCVGEMESDSLVIDLADGKVKLLEYRSHGLLGTCSMNGSLFLKALLRFEEYSMNCMLKKEDSDDQLLGMSITHECSSLAGGDEYKSFWISMVGW